MTTHTATAPIALPHPPPSRAAARATGEHDSHRAPAPVPTGRRVARHSVGLEQLDASIRKAASSAGISIKSAGVHPVPSGFEVRQAGGAEWMLCPADEDPVLARRGRMPIPDDTIADLRRLLELGFDFPTVVIAHQLTPGKGRKEVDADELLSAPGRRSSTAEATARLNDPSPHPNATRTAARVDRLATAAVRTARLAASSLGALASAPLLLDVLDPIILGAATPPGTPPDPGTRAVWFELGRWHW